MGGRRQKVNPYQRSLFDDSVPGAGLSHAGVGLGVAQACVAVESQASTALPKADTLTNRLMEEVCDRDNLNKAYERVKSNRGAPGIDGMTVDQLMPWLVQHKQKLVSSLLDGSYRPSLVRGVEIPKADGGVRQLGIPTVVDRLVQQAMLQVLTRLLDPTFSESSYGFRPGRSAHQALKQASEYVADGRGIVVDVDLEQFFDRVNHDILMSRLARRVDDKRLLGIVRRFLEAGLMQSGVCVIREEGTPQGGPLSPLLANLLLDDWDKELESRGHKFCRYADDCNIYVRSQKAGERVMAWVEKFLEGKLKLRINRQKSAVACVEERKFLGYQIRSDGRLWIASKSLERFRSRVRRITRRNRGWSLGCVVKELNRYLIGWSSYFGHCVYGGQMGELDGWIRRKLRCLRLKQLKGYGTIVKYFMREGVGKNHAWETVLAGFRWWRLSHTIATNKAMGNTWFKNLGLVDLGNQYEKLKEVRNRRIR